MNNLSLEKAFKLINGYTEKVCSPKVPASPLISICIITYNHGNFIGEAIESILMQNFKQPYELIISDDFSTDGTTEAILEYQKKYPDLIRVFLSKKNLGHYTGNGRLSLIRSIQACRGKYIALLDGDDYWTDPFKLQKQFEFLEANPDFSMCFHDALIMENGELTKKRFLTPQDKTIFDTEDTLNAFKSFAPTASILFRNNLLTPFPDWFCSCIFGDRTIFTMLSRYGKIKNLDFIGAVRRIHQGGISSNFTLISNALNRIIFYKNMSLYLEQSFTPLCNRYIKHFYLRLIRCNFNDQSGYKPYPVAIIKGLQYLLSPAFLTLLKVTSIKKEKSFINLMLCIPRTLMSKLHKNKSS